MGDAGKTLQEYWTYLYTVIKDMEKKIYYVEIKDKFETKHPVPRLPRGYEWNAYEVKSRDDKLQRSGHIRAEYDPDTMVISLERNPTTNLLALRPNTTQLWKKHEAVKNLTNVQKDEQLPLHKLFEGNERGEWPSVNPEEIEEWYFLDGRRDGARKQREFVSIALGTRDFAFLEGPPGSGKSTVLCELICQMVERKKRVLVCSPTHVAVDNIVEKLVKMKGGVDKHGMILVRTGNLAKISVGARKRHINEVSLEIQKNILSSLGSISPKPESAEILEAALVSNLQRNLVDGEKALIDEIVLKGANVLCGTPIGIINNLEEEDLYDMLIMDEASKATFQDFLVPAMHARKWIIVGDVRQLAPYTDEDEVALNINTLLPGSKGGVALDVFDAYKGRRIVVLSKDDELKRDYQKQCEHLGVEFFDADIGNNLGSSKLIIGTYDAILDLKLSDKVLIRDRYYDTERPVNHAKLLKKMKHVDPDETRNWGYEVGWRVTRIYGVLPAEEGKRGGVSLRDKDSIREVLESRMKERDVEKEMTYLEDLEKLMPEIYDANKLYEKLENMIMVAFPSILESIQYGLRIDASSLSKTAPLGGGMDEYDFSGRHVLLEYQHRMHPDIAAFSHKHVYNGEALKSGGNMARSRDWGYHSDVRRMRWIEVKGRHIKYTNQSEAERVVSEILEFAKYAKDNPNPRGKWEVTALSFYRNQVMEISKLLKRSDARSDDYVKPGLERHFVLPGNNQLTIEVCTVDAFQGHESDVVFLSIVNGDPTSFVNNRNRLNVALTRARYQCSIIGDRSMVKSMSSPIIRYLADNPIPNNN